MVHWSFLIIAFVAGAGGCYLLLYQLSKVLAQIEGAIERGTGEARFW